MNKKHYSILIALSITLFLASCKKVQELSSDVQVSQDVALAQRLNNILQDMSNQTVENGTVSSLKRTNLLDISAAIVTVDSSNKPIMKYTVRFDSTAMGISGTVVAGTLFVTTNGKKYNEDGASATIASKGLSIDGNVVSDDMTGTLTNLATSAGYEESWSYSSDYTITTTEGKKIDINATGKRHQTAGYKTVADRSDDAFKGEIDVNGTASNGAAFSITTESPLIKLASCKYVTGGTLNWTSNGITKMIDFGNGTACDATAIVTVSGIEYKVELK